MSPATDALDDVQGRRGDLITLTLCLWFVAIALVPAVAAAWAVGGLILTPLVAGARAVRTQSTDRTAWALMGIGAPLVAISEVLGSYTTGSVPWLGTIGLSLMALSCLAFLISDPSDMISASLQSAVISASGFMVLWRLTEPSSIRWMDSSDLVSSIYPIANTVLMITFGVHAALATWSRMRMAPRHFFVLCVFATAATIVIMLKGATGPVRDVSASGIALLSPAFVLESARWFYGGLRTHRRPATLGARGLYLLSGLTVATMIFVGFGSGGLEPTLAESVTVMVFCLVATVLYEWHRSRSLSHSLAEREHHLRLLVSEGRDVIVQLDAEGKVWFSSDAVKSILGTEPAELVGKPVDEVVPDLTPEALDLVRYDPTVTTQETLRVESALLAENGNVVHTESVVTPLAEGHLVAIRDVTERVGLQSRLQQVTYHDSTTGLPNQASLEREIRHRLYEAASGDIALVLIDTTPRDAGRVSVRSDLLLAVGTTLRATARTGDLVARISDHRFGILLRAGTGSGIAVREAQRIVGVVESASLVGDTELVASAGVCVGGNNGVDLLRNAELALQEAEKGPAPHVRLYEPDMLARYARTRDLRRRISRTPSDDRWTLLYQPLVDLNTGAVTGAEALLRWIDPDGDFIGIEEVIRIAEESGSIIPLGRWVLDRAAAQAATWQRAGIDTRMSINVSAIQLAAPGFVDIVAATLRRHELEANRLVLEITETAVLELSERTTATLLELRELGVRIAIDDFGTGYAGLANIRAMPLDILKIDRSFIQGLGLGGSDEAVVNAVTQLGLELGLTITAEGVETAEQEHLARSLGIRTGQGYLYARPLSAHDITQLIHTRGLKRTVAG